MKIYLCSRVAYDARPLNNAVASTLRTAGYEVYVPHEQAPNNLSQGDIDEGRYGVEMIFHLDYAALRKANVVVAVGRMGSDCSWELGYAWAHAKPVVHVPGADTTWTKSPMLIPTLTAYTQATPDTVDVLVAQVLAKEVA